MTRKDIVWQQPLTTASYLQGVRGIVPLANEQIDVMLRLLDAAGGPIAQFLDLGCGDGVLAQAVADRYPEARGVLIDFSEPMLEAARRRLRSYGGRMDIRHGDFADPGWAAGLPPMDAVISAFAIHHQTDAGKRSVYETVFRLLRRGGLFVNIEHVSSPTPWIERLHDELFIERLSTLEPGRAGDEVRAAYHARADKAANILASVEDQCAWLRHIGFTDVDCYLKIFELAVFGGRKP